MAATDDWTRPDWLAEVRAWIAAQCLDQLRRLDLTRPIPIRTLRTKIIAHPAQKPVDSAS